MDHEGDRFLGAGRGNRDLPGHNSIGVLIDPPELAALLVDPEDLDPALRITRAGQLLKADTLGRPAELDPPFPGRVAGTVMVVLLDVIDRAVPSWPAPPRRCDRPGCHRPPTGNTCCRRSAANSSPKARPAPSAHGSRADCRSRKWPLRKAARGQPAENARLPAGPPAARSTLPVLSLSPMLWLLRMLSLSPTLSLLP